MSELKEIKEILLNMQADINSMKMDINNMKSDMNNMKADISNIKTEIVSVKADVENMKEDINHIKNNMTSKDEILSVGDVLQDVHAIVTLLADQQELTKKRVFKIESGI